jgi:DNA gyrase subunit B
MAKKTNNPNEYTGEQIEKLADLDAIRKLAGMYVGNKGAHGLNHILFEVVDNAVDEAMAGFGSVIKVSIAKDGTVTVSDNGRGIPVDWKADAEMSALTQLFTQRHTGGKFGSGAYSSSGGLHGIGIKATNAFSSKLEVEVRRYGLKFRQRFENGGEVATNVQIYEKGNKKAGEIDAHTTLKIGKNGLAEALIVKGKPQKVTVTSDLGTGTDVSFRPNRAYFSREMDWPKPEVNVPWDVERITNRLRQIAYLYPGIKLVFMDERDGGKKQIFESEKGLVDYLAYLNEGYEPLHKAIYFESKSEIDDPDNEKGKAPIKVEIVMQYAGDETEIHAFTNAIPNPLGGTHVKGFKAALTKAVKSFAVNKKLIKGDDDFKGDDALLGLTAIISITMGKTPQFSSQTKEELTSPEVNGPVLSATYDFLSDFLDKNIPVGKIIVNQAVAAARGREAAAQARQLVIKRSALDAGEYVLGKLADVQRRSGAPTVPLDHTALYLVEGDSAGGSCKMGRDSRYHAILPMRGKIPNIEKKVQLNKLLTNKEIASIVAAIGGGVAADFNIETMRYGRICILTDADDDGYHIATLLVTLFWKIMRPMVEQGRLFIARPPLYQIKKGNDARYVYTKPELGDAVKEMGGTEKVNVQRYKGLGEMNPEQLRETVFVLPESAKSKNGNGDGPTLTIEDFASRDWRVTVEDAHDVNALIDKLMGSDVSRRKKWLVDLDWDEED